MAEKRMVIVDSDLLDKIDANRGDLSQSEFLKFLIENQLGGGEESASGGESQFVEREEFEEFAQGMKDLLRRFLDFFISYGMELGEEPKDHTFGDLVKKLQQLSNSTSRQKTSK